MSNAGLFKETDERHLTYNTLPVEFRQKCPVLLIYLFYY